MGRYPVLIPDVLGNFTYSDADDAIQYFPHGLSAWTDLHLFKVITALRFRTERVQYVVDYQGFDVTIGVNDEFNHPLTITIQFRLSDEQQARLNEEMLFLGVGPDDLDAETADLEALTAERADESGEATEL